MLLESEFYWPSQLVDQLGLDTSQYEANWRKLIAAINVAQTMANASRVKVIEIIRDASLGIGSQVVTGVGFSPTAIVFFAASLTIGPGACVGAWSQGLNSGFQALRNSEFVVTTQAIALSPETGWVTAVVSAVGEDGFTLAWDASNPPPAKTFRIVAICIR